VLFLLNIIKTLTIKTASDLMNRYKRFNNYHNNMKKITPHLWFDKEAVDAAKFYTSILPNSKILNISTLHNTPSGDCDIASFELDGKPFMAISAGPVFKINPSISFFLNFDPSEDSNAREHLNDTWDKLSKDGKILMELNKYPFSEWYGWVQDKYGVSWQLILTNPAGEKRPFIVPSLMFVGVVSGKAEEAINYYTSVFKHSKRGATAKYPAGMDPDKEGTIMFADFMLENQWFAAMDSAHKHDFQFNEAISLLIPCDNQNEIDYYWSKLSAVPEAEQCGWVKDQFGISWQVWPTILGELMQKGNKEQIARLTESFLKMKKFEIKKLHEAFDGK
jgi:predicted 3-demethylubiquinone-9 3-methyltransferase (glyoxalase superfamily)